MTVEWARTVHDLPAAPPPLPPDPRRPFGGVLLEGLLGLAASLRAAGYEVGDVVDRVEEISDAITRAVQPPAPPRLDGLADLDPDEVGEEVRRDGLSIVAVEQMGRVRADYDRELARVAAEHLRAQSDAVVAAMRVQFDPLAVVQTAAAAGLQPHTDAKHLADHGSEDAIAAYRALPPAVATLDRVASLRFQMAQAAAVGPRQPLMANLLADAPDLASVEGAQAVWEGDLEHVTYEHPHWRYSHPATVRRERLGGPWLALVAAGHRLRVNTAAEADDVMRKATRGQQLDRETA